MDISNEIEELKKEIKALKKRVSMLEHDIDPNDIVYGPAPRRFDFDFGDGWGFGDGWDEPISPGPGRHGEW